MSFKHFPEETVTFFNDLSKNNNKNWFAENKKRYEDYVIAPAKEFVLEMGQLLKSISPNITYEPKIDRSIFRIYRDARLHKGKAPFKTNLGIIFWEGENRLESSCYYFHIEPPFYFYGVGMARFTPEILKEYRLAVTEEKRAAELFKIFKKAEKENWETAGEKLQKLPKGYTPIRGMEELLFYKSLYLSDETPINADFYKDDFLNNTFETFKKMEPYHKWLTELTKRARERG